MKRVFQHECIFVLSEEVYKEAIRQIVAIIKEKVIQFDYIIGISRGGNRIAIDLSHFLSCPYFLIDVKNNKNDNHYNQSSEYVTIKNVSKLPLLLDRKVLLVDDISGSGLTLKKVIEILEFKWKMNNCQTFCICLNTGSIFRPNFFLWKVADWVVFPWEEQVLVGTIKQLENPMVTINI